MPPPNSSLPVSWSNLESGLVFPPVSQSAVFCGVIGAEQVYKTAVSKSLMSYGPSHALLPSSFQSFRGWSTEGLKLDHILKMTQEQLQEVSTTLMGAHFGSTHLFLANQVGLVLFALDQQKKKSPLLRLRLSSETSFFWGGLRAMLIYGHVAHAVNQDPLIKEVVALVDSLTPLLQLAFEIPLLAPTRTAIQDEIDRLRN